MSRPLTLDAKAYRASLQLYPPAFRREFAGEMLHDFRDASRDVRGLAGWRARASFWLFIATDLLITIPLEWCRTGLPLLVLAALAPGAMFLGLLARVNQQAWLVVPERAADRDVLALLLLVTVLLFLILATIMFTLWFARPRVPGRW
jgi:hypothetical protein